jgi:hypothetical protein
MTLASSLAYGPVSVSWPGSDFRSRVSTYPHEKP